MGLQADLIGAYAPRRRNIPCATGDPPSLGDTKQSTAVYDVIAWPGAHHQPVSTTALMPGRIWGRRAVSPLPWPATRARRPGAGGRSLHQKVSGGAHFTMTQTHLRPASWRDFLRTYEERFTGAFPVPVLIGVLPLRGHKHASFPSLT